MEISLISHTKPINLILIHVHFLRIPWLSIFYFLDLRISIPLFLMIITQYFLNELKFHLMIPFQLNYQYMVLYQSKNHLKMFLNFFHHYLIYLILFYGIYFFLLIFIVVYLVIDEQIKLIIFQGYSKSTNNF